MSNERPDRARQVAHVIAAYEQLMHRLAVAHAPVFAEVDLTMAQSKALYVVFALGRPRMSDVAARLRVSMSTASEVVDRLVALELIVRETDDADRRHVILVATPRAAEVIERFRELGVAQLQDLLERVSPDELEVVRRSIEILDRVARDTPDQDPVGSAELDPVDQSRPSPGSTW
jgi:DNA-binding MarR family transcriptional regulator